MVLQLRFVLICYVRVPVSTIKTHSHVSVFTFCAIHNMAIELLVQVTTNLSVGRPPRDLVLCLVGKLLKAGFIQEKTTGIHRHDFSAQLWQEKRLSKYRTDAWATDAVFYFW